MHKGFKKDTVFNLLFLNKTTESKCSLVIIIETDTFLSALSCEKLVSH